MQIKKIKSLNINNLKGQNEIDFDQLPLSEASIFAITGPTGSGKSTILDVITLALFNKIPRFASAMTKSQMEGLGSVVTHHMTEAMASITYEIKGVQYTSEWTVHRAKKSGKLQDYHMTIYDAQGKPLDLKRAEVPAKNEEIIGLKYEQFVKSIILAQGQFTKFLKADKKERSKLLENITGTYLYRKIGVACFEKWKSLEDEKKHIQISMDAIQLLDEELVKGIEDQITGYKSQKLALDKDLTRLNEAYKIKEAHEKAQAELEIKTKALAALAEQETKLQSELSRLAAHEKIAPYRTDIVQYDKAVDEIKHLQEHITTATEKMGKAKDARQKTIEAMSLLTQEDVSADNFKSIMNAFEKEVTKLSQDLLHIKSKGKDTRSRIYRIIDDQLNGLSLPKAPAEAMSVIGNHQNELKAQLASSGVDMHADESELSNLLQAERNQLEDWLAMDACQNRKAHSEKEQDENQAQAKSLAEQLKSLDAQIPTAEKYAITLKEKIELLQKQKHDAAIIQSLSSHRAQLVDGSPCPLCGALEHPYSEGHGAHDASELEQTLTESKKESQQATESLQALLQQKGKVDTAIAINQTTAEKIAQELKSIIEEQEVIRARGNVSLDKGAQEEIAVIQKRIEALEQARGSLALMKGLNLVQVDYELLAQILQEHSELNAQLSAKYQGVDVKADCDRLQDRFAASTEQILKLKTDLSNYEQQLIKWRKDQQTLQSSLDAVVLQQGYADIATMKVVLMPETEVSHIKSHKQQIDQKKIALQTELKSAQNRAAQSQKDDAMPDQSIDLVRVELNNKSRDAEIILTELGKLNQQLANDAALRKGQQEQTMKLNAVQSQLEDWTLLKRMIGDAKGEVFASFAQGITLKNLLVYANVRLKELSDRYLLDMPSSAGTLTVIDRYQGNTSRSVATLSGGESFLLSLALALSLSDMASRNVSLDSLFIDEGFGTLDEDTLDIALNTLEQLQSKGNKTVGVISHVAALKERINVQIKLEKDAQGYSKIAIES